jgi:hypothetical protein
VLTSAATTTALAYFQALAQEAARDTYVFLKRLLRPGHSLPDRGIDHGASQTASPMWVRVVDDAEHATVELPAQLPGEAYAAAPASILRPVPGMWLTVTWRMGDWTIGVRELEGGGRPGPGTPGPAR